jgi:aminopeptidase N
VTNIYLGFYRVNYDKKNWALLTAALNSENFSGIHVINRAQLLDDALALARAGQLDYATAMGVTSYLEKELDYIPWKAALNALSYIDTMLVRTSVYANFKVRDYLSNFCN